MKIRIICAIILSITLIYACKTLKKQAKPATNVLESSKTNTSNTKPRDGVFEPGNEELTALQSKYKELNMQTLKEGYAIYIGACTNCHNAKSIYSRQEESWQGIIDDMAPKAKLTATEKDAVYKYVLCIKATQPENSKKKNSNNLYNFGGAPGNK